MKVSKKEEPPVATVKELIVRIPEKDIDLVQRLQKKWNMPVALPEIVRIAIRKQAESEGIKVA